MFDLEEQISEWRKQMLAAGIKTPAPLEELEIHLREDIEQQMKFGLSAQTAFPIAVKKIGQANLLKTEFKKVGSTAAEQRIAARCFYVVCGIYPLFMIYAMSKNDLSVNEWLLGLTSFAVILLSDYVVWRFTHQFFPALANKRFQSVIGCVGGILGVSWFLTFAYFILPRCDFTTGQLMVAVLWAMVPALVLPNLAFLMIDKIENQSSRPQVCK